MPTWWGVLPSSPLYLRFENHYISSQLKKKSQAAVLNMYQESTVKGFKEGGMGANKDKEMCECT